ncbi:hypothetical protein Tco_0955426 [Tanacetum coccineum]|uniref:Uncharacterized protein n=1 Tax=Tanacetum coccineum TaxID=301880 RepID=A0ABQ5E755_9ASTR
MFHLNEEDDLWKSQEKWNIVSWKLHKSTGVHTLKTDTEMCDVPQCRMASRVLGNPSLGSNSNTSSNDQAAAIKEIHVVETLFRVKFASQTAGASAKDQPNVNSYFRTLVADPVFDGVNVSNPHKVVEKEQLGETWAEKDYDEYQRLFYLNLIPGLNLERFWRSVFKEDDISLIATFIGKPVMLDSYTSFMYNESWGRSSFARCLIRVNSEVDLVDVVTTGIPSLSGDGFTKETIRVEYEWRPPRCDICKILVMLMTIALKSYWFLGKRNVRYEPKVTITAAKKGATYVGNTPQSSSMLKTTGNSSKKDNLSMSNSLHSCLK